MKLTIILCLFAVVFSAQAESLEYLPVDPLPENAEEIALEFLENFMAQRYPGEDITIGEPMRLYLPDGEQNALDFPLAINIEGEVSFEREKEIFENRNRASAASKEYEDELQDDPHRYSILREGNDETFNALCEERSYWGNLDFSHTNIVLIFSEDNLVIVGDHNNNIMHIWDIEAIEKECGGRFISYGILSPSPTTIAPIHPVFMIPDGTLYWHCVNDWEYDRFEELDYNLGYPYSPSILDRSGEWHYFSPGLLKSAITFDTQPD